VRIHGFVGWYAGALSIPSSSLTINKLQHITLATCIAACERIANQQAIYHQENMLLLRIPSVLKQLLLRILINLPIICPIMQANGYPAAGCWQDVMNSAAVCMVCSQLDRILWIASFMEVGCTCLYTDLWLCWLPGHHSWLTSASRASARSVSLLASKLAKPCCQLAKYTGH
jgi:hypothetical protein